MSEYKSEYRKKLRELNDTKEILSTLEGELQKLYKKSVCLLYTSPSPRDS